MRRVHLLAEVLGATPDEAFALLTDFARFPAIAEEVRSVQVFPGNPRHSAWEVTFRRGRLRWREWEKLDPAGASVEFGQTDGDFEHFRGAWRITETDTGCAVDFQVDFDFGIDSLAEAMDPVAERLLRRVMRSVLSGLFGEDTQLHDLPAHPGERNHP
ncbi:type II toxin-antitoxin system RatA family toxin [Crossiella cryophila]|uniref:Ribosome-associated toxin RatA of RatAB toxin-antitoxin module n=1 Tax=Crossiella cryophila TaxID=43355 RepID=A0A7W7CHJ3_9PSEU|nr:SRPBCC family protein [Crossiella cryophila]MBB4681296.1 ribosome-associated toxin RatA of RatAB toxin-antitoxin module [Crossiella cryophila]